MDDYKIALGALLDANAKGDINKQLNAIEDLSVTISKATLSNDVINDIKRQLTQNGIDLKLVFGNVGQITSQAKQTGQQIGQQINQGISQSINNSTGLLNTFKLSLQNIGMGSKEIDAVANRIQNLGVQIESLNQSKSHSIGKNGKDILSVDISGTDSLGQAIKLTEQYNIATGELIRSIDAVSTAQQKSSANTSSFIKQQSQAVSNLTNQINQLNRSAIDQNASRPISDATHLNNLSTAYNDVISAINKMGNASSNAFTTEKNNVKTLISDFKSLVSEYRNAENVSIKMKGTDITSGIAIATNDFEKFKAEAKDFPQITQTINNLNSAISNVADASSLNSFNDQLRIARSELSKIKSETSTLNKEEKVGINISNLKAQISDLQRISPVINTFEADVNGAKTTIQSLLDDLTRVNTQSDFSVVNSKWKAFTNSAKSAGIAITETISKADNLSDIVKNITQSYENGTYDAKVESIIAKTRQWVDEQDNARISTATLQSSLEKLSKAYIDLNSSGGYTVENQKKLKQAESELSEEIKKVTNEITKMNAEYAKSSKVESFNQKLTEFYDKNSATHKKWGTELKQMMDATAYGAKITNSELINMERRFTQIGNEARQAGKLGLSFFDSIKEQAKKFTQWVSVASVLMEGVQAFRKATSNVIELDTKMVELSKVSDLTAQGLENVTNQCYDLGESLSKTGTDVLDAVTTFKRAGYDIADSMKYAEEALKTANISENLKDASQNANSLVNIMKGFQNETPEFAKKINDAVNQVSNTEAVDFDNLIDGATRLSAVADQAGLSFEQMLGTLTGGYEILGNMEKVATGQITIFSRLQAIQLDGEEEVSTVAKLQEKFSNATKGAVNIVDQTSGQLRNVYDILDDLAGVWDTLDKNTREALAIEAAGIRQKQVFLALMQNWKGVEDAVESAKNSLGSADEENEKYINSIQGKLENLESATQKLSKTLIDSDLVKFFVALGTTGVKAIDGLVNALGSLGTIGLGAGLLASFKGAGIFKTINGDLTLFNKTLIATKDNLRSLETVNSTVYNKHGVFNLEGLTTSATKSVSSFTKLSNAFKAYNGNLSKSTQLQTAYIKAVGNQNSALGNYLAGLNGAKASMSGYIKSLVAAKAASIGLQVASIALNTAITMGVSLAISALVSQISKWIHAQEEARQKSVELTNSYKEQQSSLDSQIEKYKELKETLDKGNLSTDESRSIKEQLLEIQNSLIESYGNEASNIDLVNGKYKEQLGLLSELSKEKASDYVTENRDVFADAKEALEKIRTYNLGTLTSWSSYAPKTEDQQKLIDYIETYSDLLELVYTGASYGNMSNTSVKLSVKADVENADELMHQLSIDLEKFAKENNIDVSGILENIPGQLRKTWTDELTEYKTIYDEFIKAEIVRNDTLRPLYQQSIQAVEDYNNALSTGEGVEEAKANLDSVQQSVQNATGELEGSQYVFDSIYDGINRDAEAVYNLGQAFESDKTVQEYAEQLRDLTDIDLKAINFEDTVEQPGEKAFTSLMTYLGYTKEQVQDLIDKLVELGYVQGEIGTSAPSNETDISWALSEENSKAIDDFQGKIKDLKGVLESLKTGDLENNDLVDIMQTFPELQNASGDLETAIKSLIDTLLNNLLSLLGSDAPTQLVESIRAIANVVDDVDLSPIEKSIAGMSKVSETLKPLNSVFEDFKENTYLSQESIESLQKSFGKLDSFDAFISTVTKAGITEQELDSALDKIITDYLDQTDALDSLNVGTAEYVANVLSEVGVSNSLEVVISRLGLTLDEYARLKEYANEKGIDLCNVTSSEIASILSEIGVTEDAITSFANLALAKENTNVITIDNTGDIKNLGALVKACGAATSALSALADAKMLMERANKGDSGAISQLESLAKLSGASSVDAWYQSLVNKSQREVDTALKNAGNRNATANFTAPDYKYTPKKEKKAKEKKEKKAKEKKEKQVKETEIDYAKNTIEDLKDSYEDLARVTSNLEKNGDLTDYYKKRTKAIQDENDALTALIGTESKVGKNGKIIKGTGLTGARESYEKEYEKALEATGNADKYRKLIENGSLDVKTYKGKLGENLKTALDAYGKIRETDNEIATYEDKIAENNRKIKEDSKEQAEYKLKEKEHEEEIAANNKEKNDAIDKQIEQLETLRDIELANAKSPEEVSQINNEYDNKINSLKDKKASNSEDTYKLKQEGLEIDKEEAKSLDERNKIIEKEKKNRKKIYEQALKQADTDEEKTRLEREYNDDMSAYDNEQKKNIQDKLQMQYDSIETQKNETATVAEKNRIIEQEKFLRERIYLQAIAQAKTEEDRNKLQKEYLADIKTLDKEAADNITNAKNSYIDLQETIANLLDNDVELRKAMGENITEADYGDLINQQLHIKQLYQQQYDEQLKILDTLEPTSEEWDKTVDIMSNALAKINACDNAILKYNKAMKETPVENIKKGIDALNRLKDEVTDMLGLLDNNSKNGMTAMTLYQKKLSIIEAQIQQNNQAMSLLNANTEEFQELQAENRNLASEQLSIYEELSKIKIDSINEETERMKELVDLKKKENEEEYNKQKLTKQIAKDNESLAKMEAKLQQLRTNNSDGANNKLILELESRLAKKKEELSDEQLEREYEAKQDALDKEYELKEKANQKEIESIENSNDKKEQIAKEMLAGVAYTYEGYFKDVNSMANTYGIKLTDSIKSQWKDRQSAVEEYIAIAKQAVTISSSTPNDYNVGNNGQRDKNIDSFTIGTADANDIKTNPPKKAESVESQIMNILKHGEGATAKSDLNKYIVSKYGKKPISYKQMSTLYNLLTGDNTTSKDFKGNMPLINDLLSQLKNAGFSKGGIIERASKIIKGNGDNVLITARTGESILTEEQTKAFMNFKNYTPAFTNVARNLPLNNVQRKSDINVTIPIQFHDCVTNDEMLRQMKGIVYDETNGAINEILRKM